MTVKVQVGSLGTSSYRVVDPVRRSHRQPRGHFLLPTRAFAFARFRFRYLLPTLGAGYAIGVFGNSNSNANSTFELFTGFV